MTNGVGQFSIKRLDGKPLQVSVVSASPSIAVRLGATSPSMTLVHFSTTPLAVAGIHQEDVVFGIGAGLPPVVVPVSWTSSSKYKVVPESLNLGLVPFGTVQRNAINVTASHADRLKVVSSPEGFVAKIVGATSDHATLQVEWSAKGGNRLVHANITLSTGDAKEPRVVIPVYAAVDYSTANGGCPAEKPCTATN